MKKVSAILDGLHIILNVPETIHEFREGARLVSGALLDNEGFLFDFNKKERLLFENSGVSQDLTLLFIEDLIGSMGVVSEVKQLNKFSGATVSSDYMHSVAVELPRQFCYANRIDKGSILTIEGDYYGNLNDDSTSRTSYDDEDN